MSRNALFVPHDTLIVASGLSPPAAHSPTSHPSSASWPAATLGRSITSAGRSRTFEISHLSPVLVHTMANRLISLTPVGAVRSTVPSSRQISGRRNLRDVTRTAAFHPLVSGAAFLNRPAILSAPLVCWPASST